MERPPQAVAHNVHGLGHVSTSRCGAAAGAHYHACRKGSARWAPSVPGMLSVLMGAHSLILSNT